MKHENKPATLSPALEKARDRFEIWRSRKKSGTRIPKALWQAAIECCKSDSVFQVSKTLRLNYMDLKERVETSEESRTLVPKNSPFVELGFLPSPTECTLELETRDGAKMKIQYKGMIDPLALCETFWRQGS